MAASITRADHAAACDLPEDLSLCKATFDGWRYKHYFEFVERNTTSNLTKHPEAPTETARTHTKLVAKEPWSNMNVTSNVTNFFLQGVIM